MGRLKQISSVVISISLAFFVLGGVAALLFSRPQAGWKALDVTTGSMRPEMPPGSLIFVHRVPEASLKVGDVITYTNPFKPQQTVTHRIIAITLIGGKARGFITKGDANHSADPQISSGMVVGKRVASVPYLGKILSWTHTLWGIALLIYLPTILIIIGELRRLARYYKGQALYRLPSFERSMHMAAKSGHSTIIGIASMSLSIVVACAFVGLLGAHVSASLASNPVVLSNNTLTTSGATQGGGTTTCTSNSNNSVNFTSNNNQTATSGNASSNNNTNSDSTSSGNASNTSNTNVTITTVNTGSCHQTNP